MFILTITLKLILLSKKNNLKTYFCLLVSLILNNIVATPCRLKLS